MVVARLMLTFSKQGNEFGSKSAKGAMDGEINLPCNPNAFHFHLHVHGIPPPAAAAVLHVDVVSGASAAVVVAQLLPPRLHRRPTHHKTVFNRVGSGGETCEIQLELHERSDQNQIEELHTPVGYVNVM